MKKFFFLASIFTLAFTAAMFTSCSKDNDPVNDVDPTPQEEPYKAIQFWASNDLLEIADITVSGVVTSYSFTETKTVHKDFGEGKVGIALDVTNVKPEEEFQIVFKLKSNWEEIIGDRENLTLATARSYVIFKKGAEFVYSSNSKGAGYRGRANVNIKYYKEMTEPYEGGLQLALESILDMCGLYLRGIDLNV